MKNKFYLILALSYGFCFYILFLKNMNNIKPEKMWSEIFKELFIFFVVYFGIIILFHFLKSLIVSLLFKVEGCMLTPIILYPFIMIFGSKIKIFWFWDVTRIGNLFVSKSLLDSNEEEASKTLLKVYKITFILSECILFLVTFILMLNKLFIYGISALILTVYTIVSEYRYDYRMGFFQIKKILKNGKSDILIAIESIYHPSPQIEQKIIHAIQEMNEVNYLDEKLTYKLKIDILYSGIFQLFFREKLSNVISESIYNVLSEYLFKDNKSDSLEKEMEISFSKLVYAYAIYGNIDTVEKNSIKYCIENAIYRIKNSVLNTQYMNSLIEKNYSFDSKNKIIVNDQFKNNFELYNQQKELINNVVL